MAIADLRKEYTLSGLRRRDLEADPTRQFQKWFGQASGAKASGRVMKFLTTIYKAFLMLAGAPPPDVNAMTLATADKDGKPSARTVLLKGVDKRGFVFFTNYESRKGQELAENDKGALVFYWPELERQVCVAGAVRKLPEAESEAYFKSRPRGSRIGAWASKQSTVVKDRPALEEIWQSWEKKFAGGEVSRPPHWGGYLLEPDRIEFWQGRPNRMHDRFRYARQADGTWQIDRLAP